MGIVNIEDELHEQLRRASKASCRSINAQAAFWIKLGMLCELNPGLSFQELMARELKAAGVGRSDADPLAGIVRQTSRSGSQRVPGSGCRFVSRRDEPDQRQVQL